MLPEPSAVRRRRQEMRRQLGYRRSGSAREGTPSFCLCDSASDGDAGRGKPTLTASSSLLALPLARLAFFGCIVCGTWARCACTGWVHVFRVRDVLGSGKIQS